MYCGNVLLYMKPDTNTKEKLDTCIQISVSSLITIKA